MKDSYCVIWLHLITVLNYIIIITIFLCFKNLSQKSQEMYQGKNLKKDNREQSFQFYAKNQHFKDSRIYFIILNFKS